MSAIRVVAFDTSVVLRLLVGLPADQARRARAFYEATIHAGRHPMVSDLVVSEVYYALQFHYGITKERALAVLADFLHNGNVLCAGVAAEVLAESGLATANPGFIDRMIHDQYFRRHQADQLATFEKSARKLPRTVVL